MMNLLLEVCGITVSWGSISITISGVSVSVSESSVSVDGCGGGVMAWDGSSIDGGSAV
jgi:hypothetical protein